MNQITIEPATSPRFDDIQQAFADGGDGAECQCMWWLLTGREFETATVAERTEKFRAEIDAGPPPGLVAYVDGVPAAWVRVGPRTRQPRLARTRNYAASPVPFDDPGVWAVSCFVVRRDHRKQGLTPALLDAAVNLAREGGARIIEAYPIDVSAKKVASNDLYHGTLSTFEKAGFHEVARPKPNIAIVQLEVSG
ncbi:MULTISPECIES: GNAT family N-acetyltransferase [unclassified Microbacterium]|uniref:GNAT family N-acetyltransferase n=1 Tax=unclassified Microbacterium TaxID=2609290 RepID=UPI00214B72AC|nr:MULTISPECIES: GNAT family N-acetyltransferase [unclassified Microbacterium]MCR2800563.1 GNAT family N-acetyltransferase [Microbacterium sp. zg.Y818]MCR2824675.1 GNAT family N-acetyltransferase [Microbacterium sp. zg.Y909]WIM23292.1 GNAT family N-acetyltransferase [Microbacterium sp. zg-Y818]